MNDLEMIFTMLGKASTTRIARNKDARVSRRIEKLPKKVVPLQGLPGKSLKVEAINP